MTQSNQNQKDNTSLCKSYLHKMRNSWYNNAQVTKSRDQGLDSDFDPNKPDFRPDLLPFHDHPTYQKAPFEVQNLILSCGWLIYNWKTVAIESALISPACIDIIYKNIPGTNDRAIQGVVSETLVDEAYHILLVNEACLITKQQKGLDSLTLPQFNLVQLMLEEQEKYSESWQKVLIKLVTAIVSEIFISDYLNLLAHDTTIKPFNRKVVDIHRKDELAHGCIFKNLTKLIYAELNLEQKEFFLQNLPNPVKWFADLELNVWQAVLQQIGFIKSWEMIGDCFANQIALNRIDYSGITSLVQELDGDRGLEIFAQKGILDS